MGAPVVLVLSAICGFIGEVGSGEDPVARIDRYFSEEKNDEGDEPRDGTVQASIESLFGIIQCDSEVGEMITDRLDAAADAFGTADDVKRIVAGSVLTILLDINGNVEEMRERWIEELVEFCSKEDSEESTDELFMATIAPRRVYRGAEDGNSTETKAPKLFNEGSIYISYSVRDI